MWTGNWKSYDLVTGVHTVKDFLKETPTILVLEPAKTLERHVRHRNSNQNNRQSAVKEALEEMGTLKINILPYLSKCKEYYINLR